MATTGRIAAFALAMALAACGGNGQGLDDDGRPIGENTGGGGDQSGDGPFQPTIEDIQAHVFTPICSRCHHGALAPQGLHLSDTRTSYDNLVNVASQEEPQLKRVLPGNPDDSYIIHKIEGTQESGDQMPDGCPSSEPCLDHDTIAVIRQWIADGAPPPASSNIPALLESAP
ncbi:MAG TPA: hypothetical protein VFB36_15245 [Nevskiaceae bacterium]|nr:hypothetical protein [Nevskiaceae bacterium]